MNLNSYVIIQNSRGQFNKGVELQENFMANTLKEINLDKKIDLEFCPPSLFKNCTTGNYETYKKCFDLIDKQNHTIFFGGDHYSSFGPILASLKKYGNDFRLVWIDAHADIHSFETSPSKNMHGMIVRFLIEHNYPDIPRLKPEQILYIGLRSVEDEEWNYIKENNIQYIEISTIIDSRKFSSNSTYYSKINDFIKEYPVHVSLDVDSLDPKYMCSTGTVEENGIEFEELLQILQFINKNSTKYYATDIMEYNPDIGNEEEKRISYITFKSLIQYISNLFF
jgi:arginase